MQAVFKLHNFYHFVHPLNRGKGRFDETDGLDGCKRDLRGGYVKG